MSETKIELKDDNNQVKKTEIIDENDTKGSIRKKIWKFMEQNRLTLFPRPVYFRIPNFKGSEEAAKKLLDFEIFCKSKVIQVNPDKPQGPVRILVLEQGKHLYVPIRGLKHGFLKHISVPENASQMDIKYATSLRGIDEKGKAVNIDDTLKIDLLVVGSVAVSKTGQRIGKGKGYADLEFAILQEMKAIDENTMIVTVVHDCQVFEKFSDDLFQPFDIPVDYIVTPTQIIKTESKLCRPTGIIWNLISERKMNAIPILQTLKEKCEANGIDTALKEGESDKEESRGYPIYFRKRSKPRPRPVSESRTNDENKENRKKDRPPRNTRDSQKDNKQEKKEKENDTGGGERKSRWRNLKPKKKIIRNIDFSLMVKNIEKSVRVRDLKNALVESGIKPNDITWRGYKGFCYLHYAKSNGKDNYSVESKQIDSVIETLKNLKIKPECDSQLEVTVMNRISRIETTDVTAV